jgi:hypothetical protein
LFTDDTAARLVAVTLGYRVHGTIGIVARSMRRGQRSMNEVLSLLHAIPDQSTAKSDYTRPPAAPASDRKYGLTTTIA